jgi:hypothetical protein
MRVMVITSGSAGPAKDPDGTCLRGVFVTSDSLFSRRHYRHETDAVHAPRLPITPGGRLAARSKLPPIDISERKTNRGLDRGDLAEGSDTISERIEARGRHQDASQQTGAR